MVQSHIIPRAFFEPEEKSNLKLISNVAGQYPKKAPVGVYDRIVCDECERSFGTFDDYAIKVLLQNLSSYKRMSANGKLAALVADDVDYRLLKLFTVAVLWRASVTSHSFYERISIGPFEARAREMLRTGDPGPANEFSSWWSFFDTDSSPGIMDPFREKWFGVNAYRFYFGKVVGYFKVDRKPVPQEFNEFSIGPGKPLVFVARDFEKSKDRAALLTLLRTAVVTKRK